MVASSIEPRFESIPDIISRLTALEARLYAEKDRRAYDFLDACLGSARAARSSTAAAS